MNRDNGKRGLFCMHLSYVFQLGKQYVRIGFIAAVISVLIMVVSYWFYFKRSRREEAKLPWTKFIAAGLFIFYFSIVIGATMLNRGRYEHGMAQLDLFETYKNAWYEANMVEWRNLALNVLMFCPIGFLLPFTFSCFRNWWATYLAGFECTLFIEILQYIRRCGVFQTDDLFNNAIGAMIGFGCFQLIIFVKNKWLGRDLHIRRTLLPQIPMVVTVLGFFSIFVAYQCGEYGNLKMEHVKNYDMSHVQITSEVAYTQEETTDYVRQVQTYSKEEAFELAKHIFWCAGININPSDCAYYDERATFYADNRTAAIWLNYQGGTYEMQNYTQQLDSHNNPIELKKDATLEELKQALAEYEITIPANAIFFSDGAGSYTISIPASNKADESSISGVISANYTVNGMFAYLKCFLMDMKPCKQVCVMSDQEVVNCIKNGEFAEIVTEEGAVLDVSTVQNINITSIEKNYIADSKGYFRPYYKVTVVCNDVKGTIEISAIKKS